MAKKESKQATGAATSGEVNKELVDQLNQILAWIDQRGVINKNISKAVANIKKTYNIPAYATRYEIKMRMMNPETRTEVERNIDSIRKATGVQYSFELVEDARKKSTSVNNPSAAAERMAAVH